MKYLAYGEVVEASGWITRNTIDEIKKEWYIAIRVFEVPDDFNIDLINKPRYQTIKSKFKLVFEDGHLIYEEN